MMEIQLIKQPGYETVAIARDSVTGFHALLAIHQTRLGSALGGIRMYPYQNEVEALSDVQRLARDMTYKSSLLDFKIGGGAALIIGDPAKDKTPELFQRMGEFINAFKGVYRATNDTGVTMEDLLEVAQKTPFVNGLSVDSSGSSFLTAKGVALGIYAAAHFKYKVPFLKDMHVAIQGVGQVGYKLAKLLHFEGVNLSVSDINPEAVERAVREFEARPVTGDGIYAVNADVFAPCAHGGILNAVTIPRLRASIVAGAADHQLGNEEKDGDLLFKRGILYAPDYVINAGGVINLYAREILKQDRPERWLKKISKNLNVIFKAAKAEHISTQRAAKQLAEKLLLKDKINH